MCLISTNLSLSWYMSIRWQEKHWKKLSVQSERWLHEKRLDKERLVSVHVALRTAFWRHTLFAMSNNTEKDCFFFEDQLHFDSTEEVFITNIVTCILNSFFSLLTCIGNFIVVFAIGKTRDLHSPSFILLGCLAVSDLLVGLISQPLFVGYKIAQLERNFAVFCTLKVVQSLSGFTTSGVSFGILAAVSIDRLLALTLHLRYNTIVTVPRVFQTTIALWIFATVTVLPRFWMASKWHFIPIALGVLKFFVIVISVWKIFRIVRKHQQQIKGQTKAVSHLPANTVNILKCRKSAVTVLYIYGLFLIFYLPFMVSLMIKKFVGYTRTVRIVYEYAATAVFINSCLNPVVYCWRIGEIRRAVKNFVRRSIREWQVCLFTKLSCVLNRYERQTINALFARVDC